MRLLLDSHVLLWWLAGDPRLAPVSDLIIGAATVQVSAATLWELAIKQRLGKLYLPGDLLDAVTACQFEELPIRGAHATMAAALPLLHTDPFDRMLVAQASAEGLTLVTADGQLLDYDVAVIKV